LSVSLNPKIKNNEQKIICQKLLVYKINYMTMFQIYQANLYLFFVLIKKLNLKKQRNFQEFINFDPKIPITLGTKLIKLRNERKWSQEVAADHLGVTQPAYCEWKADNAKPKTENLLKIAEVFGLDLYSLLDVKEQAVINNSTFQDHSSVVQQQYYPTINMVTPELLESIQQLTENQKQISIQQEQISKLMETQNKLIERLFTK
jgi:transcriptional regulator with XRE-family HTH domain